MSNALFNTLPPFDYKTQNYYNSLRSPSTVHVKNTRLRRFFQKYLFQKAISVFKWSGFPKNWEMNYFLYTLYRTGYIAILDTPEYGVICQGGALGGYNLYYQPSYIIITNPVLNRTITARINRKIQGLFNQVFTENAEDCVLIKLQPDYSSIMDIVGFYADLMALAAESLGINILNVKSGTVFGAENKPQADAYKKMYDSLSDGDPAVVIGKNLMNDKGEPSWFPFTQHVKESYVATDILSDMRKIEAMFCTEIGIPNANTDKRERLITDEVNANNVETSTRCEMWLDEIRDGLTKANEKYKLNLSVDWRVKPETISGGDTNVTGRDVDSSRTV